MGGKGGRPTATRNQLRQSLSGRCLHYYLCRHRTCYSHRSTILRQHSIRRLIRLLLFLDASFTARNLPRICLREFVTPKAEEMIAEPNRFKDAHSRFEGLLGKTLRLIRERTSSEFPSSIFYAYKQQEERREGTTSTGWETMLNALVNAGFQLIGTWPMRTEMQSRLRYRNFNALASSIILVCRPRPDDAPAATRREFLGALQAEMPDALDRLTSKGHIAPTDLAQAAIGPGMEIYSRYSSVRP